MICKIANPRYVAPENDAWRHDNSNSEDENDRLSGMHEKKLRYWFVKDGKRKRTPKASPTVTAPKVSTLKIVVKGIVEMGSHKRRPSKKSPPRLVDEPVLDPSKVLQQGVGLLKDTLEGFLKKNEEATAQKDQSSNVQPESVKDKEPEGVAHTDSSDADVESTETESEIEKIGFGKGPEAVKDQNVQVLEVEQVQNVEKKACDDDDVVITEERVSTPPRPENPDVAETSKPKKTTLPNLFEGFPNIQGEYKDDILLDEEYDMFHDATVKELKKKVSILEKEKEKAEADRDELKQQLEEITKVNEEIKTVVIKYAKKIKTLKEDVDDNAKLFEQLSTEISNLHVKYTNMNETNQMLHQMLSELHEASASEIKVMKLEMEALRADKAVKDEQLNMLYTVMEHHLGINVQTIYNNLEIQRVEERRA
ncbi:hypothetical protein Hanom_Chr12g01133851 [Helianthus anomalus]